MKKLSIAFFGAPQFAADVLQKILDDKDIPVEVTLVVTQPDRPAGRDQILTATPVKLLAQKYVIPVFDTLKSEKLISLLQKADLVLLYAFGEIIPAELLKMPHWGFWNIHPSLLPSFRGASPIVYPLLLGEKKTGTSLIQMDERLDHGEIIAQEEYLIEITDSQEILKERLSSIGYKLFKKSIQLLINSSLQKKEQDHSEATFTRLLTKKDGYIPFLVVQKIMKEEPIGEEYIPPLITEYCKKYHVPTTNYQLPTAIYNLFRALTPWPGVWTLVSLQGGEKRLKITGMELKNGVPSITKVQLEGKKDVPLQTFLIAYKP